MKWPKSIIFPFIVLLGGCAYQWSETGAGGAHFSKVEPVCRAQARESARRQLPFFYDRDYGPAGFPPDTRRDIEERETALCLKNKGFTRERVRP